MTQSRLRELLRALELEPDLRIRGIDRAELQKAYRSVCQVWHPDRFLHNAELRAKAEERLKEINNAYTALDDYLQTNESLQQAAPVAAEMQEIDRAQSVWSYGTFVTGCLLLFLVLSLGLPEADRSLHYRSLSPAPEQSTSQLFLADDSITAIAVEAPPLVRAAQRCDLRSIRKHLAEGAAINSADYAGISALSWAARVDCRSGAKQLLAGGADPALRAQNGYSAHAWARFHNHHTMAALLLSKK